MLYDNDFSDLRLTLDEEEDFNLIKNIYEYFYSKKNMDFPSRNGTLAGEGFEAPDSNHK